MHSLSRLAFLTSLCLTACGGNSDGSGDGGDGGDGDGETSLAEAEAYWQPAEGDWITTERAITTDCEGELSELTFIAQEATEQRCISLEFGDYRGTPLLIGRDCENGIQRYPASFELNDEGRMLDTPLEYFSDGTAEYPCNWSRSQSELVLVDGEPSIVFWVEDASLEGVIECPEELPEGTEITCIKSVYKLEAAGSQ